MYTAQNKRRENIAEYILYLWQLEDLLRALKFSPDTIWSQLVAPHTSLDDTQRQALFVWYVELGSLLRGEGKERSGHLDHTLHLIADLEELHGELLRRPAGERYRPLYARLQPELPQLRAALGRPDIGDVELCFRALYAVMLYRMKGDRSKTALENSVTELISPVVAELARVFRGVERGEIDLYEEKKA